MYSLFQFQCFRSSQESKSIRQTVSKIMSIIILLYSASAMRKVSQDMREILRDDVASEHICEFQSSEDLVELGQSETF